MRVGVSGHFGERTTTVTLQGFASRGPRTKVQFPSISDVPLMVHYWDVEEAGETSPCDLFSNRSWRRTCSGVAQAASLAGRSQAHWL